MHNKIGNVDFICADLTKFDCNPSYLDNHFNKILLDPPRLGAKEILTYLNQGNHLVSPKTSKIEAVEKIVYVSCNPATLARDADWLVNTLGYQLTHCGVMNMFPHTSHVEAIAVFEK